MLVPYLVELGCKDETEVLAYSVRWRCHAEKHWQARGAGRGNQPCQGQHCWSLSNSVRQQPCDSRRGHSPWAADNLSSLLLLLFQTWPSRFTDSYNCIYFSHGEFPTRVGLAPRDQMLIYPNAGRGQGSKYLWVRHGTTPRCNRGGGSWRGVNCRQESFVDKLREILPGAVVRNHV